METYTTACPRNCYSTCTFQVQVRDGRLHSIEAHPENVATAGGPCLKGLSYLERVRSPQRILHPLRRTGDGSFVRISWDEALDAITAKLTELREEPRSSSGTKGLLNGVGASFSRAYGGYTTIVVEPRRTETAERAEFLILPRPGTDGALALSVAHLLVKNGWIDEGFVGRLAEALGTVKPATIATGFGMQGHPRYHPLPRPWVTNFIFDS